MISFTIKLYSCIESILKTYGTMATKKNQFLRIIVSLQVYCVYCLCHSGDLTILAFCKKSFEQLADIGCSIFLWLYSRNQNFISGASHPQKLHKFGTKRFSVYYWHSYIKFYGRLYSELLLFWFLTLHVNLNQVVLCSSHYFNKLIFCSFYDL